MLAKTARLTESGDFARATKSGLRYSTANFVGYLYINVGSNELARAGLIISKSVGRSVSRNRLARKIRHRLREHYSLLPTGSLLVIRGLNKSATANCAVEINEIVGQLVKRVNDRADKK